MIITVNHRGLIMVELDLLAAIQGIALLQTFFVPFAQI
jgi:hypothetical protein